MSDDLYFIEINLVKRHFPINEDKNGVLIRQIWGHPTINKDNVCRQLEAIKELLPAFDRNIGDFTVPKIVDP